MCSWFSNHASFDIVSHFQFQASYTRISVYSHLSERKWCQVIISLSKIIFICSIFDIISYLHWMFELTIMFKCLYYVCLLIYCYCYYTIYNTALISFKLEVIGFLNFCIFWIKLICWMLFLFQKWPWTSWTWVLLWRSWYRKPSQGSQYLILSWNNLNQV
jgi:hypothetical protein